MEEFDYLPGKRTQHCWPTTPNIVGCCMLSPFAHPVACCWTVVHVVAQSLKPVKRLVRANRRNIVGSCCVLLHVALVDISALTQ